MTNQCQHGQLARVCVTCEQAAEMAQLRQYLDAAQRRASVLGEEAINLRAQRDAARADWMALRGQVAGLRKDAERYRWLRDGDEVSDYPYPVMRQGGKYDFDRTIWFEELDAAIDAARGAT